MINYLYILADTEPGNTRVFAVTPQTILMSDNGLDHWKRIFSSGNPQKRQNLNVVEAGGQIWIGTTNGLYIKEKDKAVRQYSGLFRNKTVRYLKSYDGGVLAAADGKVYALRQGEQPRKVFQIFAAPEDVESDVEYNKGDEAKPVSLGSIRDIEVSSRANIYIATTKGIFYQTKDEIKQKEWKTILPDGLSGSVTDISVDDARLIPWVFVSTDKGVFYTIGHGFKPLYRGFDNTKVSRLQLTEKALYAATERGLFYLPVEEAFSGTPMMKQAKREAGALSDVPEKFDGEDYHKFLSRFKEEPTVKEVQKMAVRYADVPKSKIDNWKKLARAKAMVPSVDVGLNRAGTDLYHWDTGQSPDVLLSGMQYTDWDVSLSWDLSDLVWSSDMTSIDSRSKLMVELREDILDEITRLYFERRRIQMELSQQMFSTPQEYLEKRMRVDELTALIDGLTGGGFSARIERNRLAQRSEFTEM